MIFAYHGYPYLIHRLTYRRTNHDNMHVRGFREEGTTTTPFDMVVLNELDRFHLAIAAIRRVPGLAERAERPCLPNFKRSLWNIGLCPRARRRHARDPGLELAGEQRDEGWRLMRQAILALNAGSSSIKFGLYDLEPSAELQLVSRGTLDLGDAPRLSAKAADGTVQCDRPLAGDARDTGIDGCSAGSRANLVAGN